MQTWQWMILAVLAVLPFALMSDFWPASERVDSKGVPIPRAWLRQIDHAPPEDH